MHELTKQTLFLNQTYQLIKPVFYITVLITLILNHVLAQQNLVYNGDFEEYDSCPTNPSFPGDLQIEHCLGWTAPRKEGTSDYFNVCNNPINGGLAGVPQNLSGFQYPLNGNGYCGFYAWALNPDGTSYREYLQTKLFQPLVQGRIYEVNFYVSYDGYNYSVEKVGVLLSENSYTEISSQPIIANPQIQNKSGNLTDSLNWTKIQGKFIAAGTEQFLTFGYFEDVHKVSDTLNTYNVPFCLPRSYYFIDGVELFESEYQIPNIFTPNKDGINDSFEIDLYVDKFSVMNRWGNLITHAENTFPVWDGKDAKGEIVDDGVYYYSIEINNYKKTGFIQLIK